MAKGTHGGASSEKARIEFYVNAEEAARIDRLLKDTKLTKAELMRSALRQYRDDHRRANLLDARLEAIEAMLRQLVDAISDERGDKNGADAATRLHGSGMRLAQAVRS